MKFKIISNIITIIKITKITLSDYFLNFNLKNNSYNNYLKNNGIKLIYFNHWVLFLLLL